MDTKKLILSDDASKRFIVCYFIEENDKLIKKVKVFSADYRQKVIKHLVANCGIKYVYMEEEPYVKLDVPHIKYCREMNTDKDNYYWYNQISQNNINIEDLNIFDVGINT